MHRGTWKTLLPFALLCFSASAAAQTAASGLDGPIRAQARRPLAFILSAPSGDATRTSSSEIIRIVSELVESRTRFFLEITDAQVVTECRGSMSCLVAIVRPDRKARPDGSPPSAAQEAGGAPESVLRTRPHDASAPAFLLVLSHVAVPGQADRLSASLIDLDVGLDVLERAPRGQVGWERDADAELAERATLLEPERASVDNGIAARAFLERIILEKLSQIWRRSGDWQPFGALELTTGVPGAAIALDGAIVGTTRPGVTRIENVEIGTHRLSVEASSHAPHAQTIEVAHDETLKVAVELVPRASERSIAYSTAVWGGAALATAGTAILVYALASHDGAVHSACFRGQSEPCAASRQFQTFSYDPAAVDDGREVNPGGVLVAPLGYGLATTGIVWSLGALIFGERERPPWWPLGIGLAAGVLSYGLSAALDGDRP